MRPHTIHSIGPLALMIFSLSMIGCQHLGVTASDPAPVSLKTVAPPTEHPEAVDLFKQADAIRTDARRLAQEANALQEQREQARRIAGAIQHSDAEHATLSPPPGL